MHQHRAGAQREHCRTRPPRRGAPGSLRPRRRPASPRRRPRSAGRRRARAREGLEHELCGEPRAGRADACRLHEAEGAGPVALERLVENASHAVRHQWSRWLADREVCRTPSCCPASSITCSFRLRTRRPARPRRPRRRCRRGQQRHAEQRDPGGEGQPATSSRLPVEPFAEADRDERAQPDAATTSRISCGPASGTRGGRASKASTWTRRRRQRAGQRGQRAEADERALVEQHQQVTAAARPSSRPAREPDSRITEACSEAIAPPASRCRRSGSAARASPHSSPKTAMTPGGSAAPEPVSRAESWSPSGRRRCGPRAQAETAVARTPIAPHSVVKGRPRGGPASRRRGRPRGRRRR